MDFARKQMEKYGWSDGKGLGKHENGISQALKPKLKRSVTGIGHDSASDFTEHWWSALYDKAAGNVEVKEKNGKTKKIKTKDSNEFQITNSTWRLKKKRKEDDVDAQYKDYFVRTAILSNDGVSTKNVRESESEDENDKQNLPKLTDEELFAACEGRTAHKGARHGLKALGKLARIAQQEEILLSQPQYSGYSHSKNKKREKLEQVVEEMNLNGQDVDKEPRKKKKKKKHCSNEVENNHPDLDEKGGPVPEKSNLTLIDSAASSAEELVFSKKSKIVNKDIEVENIEMDASVHKLKKKKRKNMNCEEDSADTCNSDMPEDCIKKYKKRKTKSAI